MAAPQTPVRRRRRPRRGTLARPINGSLYRASFLVAAIPLLLLAFTVAAPAPLARPTLPGAFDGAAALTLATELSKYPDRAPGSVGARQAARWFSQQLRPFGLSTTASRWAQRIPGLGRVPLENLQAVVPGPNGVTGETIVVMAHRDDVGTSPGANDNASGTAALIELARAYAQPEAEGQSHVQSARTIVFLSTDGGAFGGLGVEHFIATSPFRKRIVAVIDLDAIAGSGPLSVEIAGDRPRSPSPGLVATTVARLAEQSHRPPRHVGFFGQLIDLGFPFTLYEQGPFVGAGIPAVTVTTGGDRPPQAFGDDVGHLQATTLAQAGFAVQELLGSLDQGLEFTAGPASFVWLGGRIVQGWAVEVVFVALLVPFLVAIVDLYALCRRHRVAFAPAVAALRSRIGFWLFVGIVFTCFRLLGAWPRGPARPPNPATAAAGDWPVLALLGLGAIVVGGWLLGHRRLIIRRAVQPEEQLAGYAVALAALLVLSLLVVATNPFALLFVLPALHVWLWLPQLRIARAPVRLALFALGLIGPALVVLSLAWRFGLGFDAPWYLVELVAVGYVKPLTVAIALAGTAAAAQLAMLAAGRYAPYPDARERGPRGPIRDVVRTLILLVGGRPRRTEPQRIAVGR
jgi:Peptidase family M28